MANSIPHMRPNYWFATSACCEYRTPQQTAVDVIDRGMRSYEWFRDEGDKQARAATKKAGAILLAVYCVLLVLFL